MQTRVASVIARGTAQQAATELARALTEGLGGEAPALAAVFASPVLPLGELLPALRRLLPDTTLIGASTAGEFTERGETQGAVSALGVTGEHRAFAGLATGVSQDPEAAVRAALEGLPAQVNGFPHRTAVLLLDPLAGRGEEVVLHAASLLGEDTRLAGGAAGDDLAMRQTLVGCGSRAASDAVVIALLFSKQSLGVGVCHGHRPLSEPLRVTRAEGNVVFEVEGRPAWDVWREKTRVAARGIGVDVEAIPASDEGAFLLRYEAGLSAGEEYKIRAPLHREGKGAIAFACGVPEGSVVRIMETEPERQVWSAREAARRARAQLGGRDVAGALVFDCICRKLVLGDAFAGAVRGVSEELGGVPLAGFESYGEVALDAGDLSGFHNTTSVVLAFPK